MRALVGAGAPLLYLAAGCRSSPTLTGAGSAAEAAALAPYSPAPWRLLPWAERDRVVVYLSHIVISHSEAFPDPALRPLGWAPDARAARSRAEAQALAVQIATEAASHPERFAALAQQHSDDAVTRATGGSLGGVRATQLPPAFLDALTVLPPGEVSRVVGTSLGFHILLRREAPPHESVTGRRVVIRYAGTIGSSDAGASTRSREQAKSLSEQVAAEARAGSTPFPPLVTRYSEHGDRAYGGDMGVWSTLDPKHMPREIETLSLLRIGEVGAPIDSLWGFQVIERTEVAPHARYAMAAIRFKVRPEAPAEDPLSRQSAYAAALSAARQVHERPSTFGEFQKQYGSEGVETWEFGHGSPEISLALDKLGFGEIAAEPVPVAYFFVVPMRLDPALVARDEAPLSYELPLRAAPDLERLFHDGESPALITELDGLKRAEVAAALRLTGPERAAMTAALDALQKELRGATTPEARVQSYRSARQKLRDGMSEASYSRFMGFVGETAARILLQGR